MAAMRPLAIKFRDEDIAMLDDLARFFGQLAGGSRVSRADTIRTLCRYGATAVNSNRAKWAEEVGREAIGLAKAVGE